MMGGDPMLGAWLVMAAVAGVVTAQVMTEAGIVAGTLAQWGVGIGAGVLALVFWAILLTGIDRLIGHIRRPDTV